MGRIWTVVKKDIMKIAIVGFPGSGKSTSFRAVTRRKEGGPDAPDPSRAHLAVVKIPDPRLEKLKEIFRPKKVTPAEIIFEDLPGFHIPDIKDVEAMIEVLGVFSGRDPVKDIESMDTEFELADLEIINHRLSSLEKEMKQKRAGEKGLERETLVKCREHLEKKGAPLRALKLEPDEEKAVRGFQFLSRKPVLVLANTGEGDSQKDAGRAAEDFCRSKNLKCAALSAKLEAEIADLEESERGAFLKELGIEETAEERVLKLLQKAFGYITFFTVKGDETKAWPVRDGIRAIAAAGKIHSDIEKGFIKAEVVNFDGLMSCGSREEARKKGLLKLESKEYRIKDGDIVDFRFSK